ncbi:MAG: hypothetical protein J6A75_03030 [Lachnospiraceae bacterium]|nr:hypothetical protein [Lachnospiraceae bacterium]
MLDILKQKFTLQKKDVGDFSKIKVKGMHFTIEQYYAKGLGNVSFMQAKGFFGLMKMDTFIVNPIERDMPLFSYDRVHAMGNDTLILELYDTCLSSVSLDAVSKVKEEHKQLSEHDLGSHWYDSIKCKESTAKKGKKKDTPSFDKLAEQYFSAYIELAKCAKACEADKKKEKASVYVEGLLSHGGPSTDIFKQHYGEEKTADLFRNILFGIVKE